MRGLTLGAVPQGDTKHQEHFGTVCPPLFRTLQVLGKAAVDPLHDTSNIGVKSAAHQMVFLYARFDGTVAR